MRVLVSLVLFSLAVALCACDPSPADAEPDAVDGEATEAAAEATSDVPEAGDAVAGKTINPDRPEDGPPVSDLQWQTVELGFPTRGWEVHLGQGKCKPESACQALKAVKGDEEKPLATRADVSKLILILEGDDAALALVRFFTDHRDLLEDEPCSEVVVAEDGTADVKLPKDLTEEATPTFAPVKVVGFEGGYRVERTLLCMGEEKDRLVRVGETVFTEGHVEREEMEILLELEGLVPRSR